MPEFRLDADALFPTVQRQDNDFVAAFQVLTVVPFPERPVGGEAVLDERVAVDDRGIDVVAFTQ
jgi:hypothetical protein